MFAVIFPDIEDCCRILRIYLASLWNVYRHLLRMKMDTWIKRINEKVKHLSWYICLTGGTGEWGETVEELWSPRLVSTSFQFAPMYSFSISRHLHFIPLCLFVWMTPTKLQEMFSNLNSSFYSFLLLFNFQTCQFSIPLIMKMFRQCFGSSSSLSSSTPASLAQSTIANLCGSIIFRWTL